jgi:hypothetical protein
VQILIDMRTVEILCISTARIIGILRKISNRKYGGYMGTIIDYLDEYGDCSFADMPLNDVDSLLLCQLAYLKFDGLVPDAESRGEFVTIEDINNSKNKDNLFADERYEHDNRALFEGIVSGRRYRNMLVGCYVNLVDTEWETQFSAVTFIMDDGTVYVAFRGTDETIVGWKEDFNMAFMSPIPGQKYSVRYLNGVADRIQSDFYVGGHSKGGNLAMYSAMYCDENVRRRIKKVYSMDGPGFRPEILSGGKYEDIADKVVKILPHSSLVGMLFERDIHFQVVESITYGIAQHNPYTWRVEQGDFVREEELGEGAKLMDDTLNEWILSLSEEQLHAFVDTFYQIICASQAQDLIELSNDRKKSLNAVRMAAKDVDAQTQSVIKEIFKSLFEIFRLHMERRVSVRKEKYIPLQIHRLRSKEETEG